MLSRLTKIYFQYIINLQVINLKVNYLQAAIMRFKFSLHSRWEYLNISTQM